MMHFVYIFWSGDEIVQVCCYVYVRVLIIEEGRRQMMRYSSALKLMGDLICDVNDTCV